MGAYQLSLQGSYNPARGEGSQKKSIGSSDGSSRGSSNGSSRPTSRVSPKEGAHGFGFFQTKRIASQQNLEGLLNASPPRHSTACCDGLSERRDLEKRLSSQRAGNHACGVHAQESSNSMGHSFRSEDSESLALWEEKEQPASKDRRWSKLTTQSPKWLEAMRKFDTMKLAPWRSSPVHPKSSGDSPRISLDRSKTSNRYSHDQSKSWYGNATMKIRNGESRSVRSPVAVSNFSRLSGELNPASYPFLKWSDDAASSDHDSKHGSFSRLRESSRKILDEETKMTSSAVSWEISVRPEAVEKAASEAKSVATPMKSGAESKTTVESASNSVTVKIVNAVEESQPSCSAPVDAQSEYASCRTMTPEDEIPESDIAGFVNVIDFVAPLISKLQSMEMKDDSSRRVPFKWEAVAGPKQPKSDGSVFGSMSLQRDDSSPHETLRQQYIMKSQSSPLDGLYVILPRATSSSAFATSRSQQLPAHVATTPDVAHDSALTKSKSANESERLFSKLVFASTQPSSNDLGEFIESSSPRSILRGPDDSSVPSSNPSLRSDPGTPAFSALAKSSSQSISSCSASFDLNEGDYDSLVPTYNLNATAACIIVESRRVSLSFRDFGPARLSGDDLGSKEDATETSSNVELVGYCDTQLDTNALRSLPEAMQSPELWSATFSTHFHVPGSPMSPCAATERDSQFSASPASIVSQYSYAIPCEDAHEHEHEHEHKPRPRNGEFSARLGVMFSPLRLISSHDSNHSCFVATTTLSPPHDDEDGARSPSYSATSELLFPAEGKQTRRSKISLVEKAKSRSSKSRRQSSEDANAMMVSISKAMKKILSKCTVKRSTSKGKSKMESPVCDSLSAVEFQFTEAN